MLGDLDELVLRCRSEQARSYIGEAVRAYKANAYRSAIIMTWVALTYDIVDKLRQLSLLGDAAANKHVGEYDRIHKAADLIGSLKFERNLLESARREFELISDSELIDLKRIQDDRNRCAHPSLNMDGEPFSPSAELARAHIRAAVEHMLQSEPAQGRHALDIVMKEVNSDYFPRDKKKAHDQLSHGPLRHGRKALVRAFIVVLLKALLREDLSQTVATRYCLCLDVLRTLRPDIWNDVFGKEVATIASPINDAGSGLRLVSLICAVRDVWAALPAGVTAGVDTFVRSLPAEAGIELLEETYKVSELRSATEARIAKLTAAELDYGLFWFEVPPPIWERVVDGFCNARSVAGANAWAKHVEHFGKLEKFMSEPAAERICKAVLDNERVQRCSLRNAVLQVIFDAGFTGTVWSHMLAEADIDESTFDVPF